MEDEDRAQHRLFDYLEIFHNRNRRHSALGMLTPIEFEKVNTKPHEPPDSQTPRPRNRGQTGRTKFTGPGRYRQYARARREARLIKLGAQLGAGGLCRCTVRACLAPGLAADGR